MSTLILNIPPTVRLTDEQFYQLCLANRDLRFERTATGELIIMSPTGGGTGKCNAKLTTAFTLWNEQTNLGEVFDSSTGYKLPNGAERSPDVSWIKKERWDTLTFEEQEKFIPIPPDFVLELMSPSDTLEKAQAKMQEYIENGVRLGWLINRKKRQVEIYRQGKEVEVLESPTKLSGEDVLPGFVLNLQMIWN